MWVWTHGTWSRCLRFVLMLFLLGKQLLPSWKHHWWNICSILFVSFFLQLRASNKKNKTKFIEKPLDELEATYDPQWLQDKVVSCMDLMTENRWHVRFSTACDAKYRKALATLANQNWGQKGKPHPQDCPCSRRFIQQSIVRMVSKLQLICPPARTHRTQGKESTVCFRA